MKNKKNTCIACFGNTKHFCKFPAKFDFTHTMTKGKFIEYHYCPVCNSVLQYPLPSQKQLSKMVSKEYSSNSQKLIFNKEQSDSLLFQHRAIVSYLKKHKITKDVLDIGAGVGNLCSMLIDSGIKCKGVELSPELVKYAKKRKLPIENKNLEEIRGEKIYSAILMTHVFEHLAEPEKILHHINRLLKPNGLFLSVQPTAAMTNFLSRTLRLNNLNIDSNFEVSYLNLNPWHIVIYSIKGMELIAKRFGFKTVEVIPMASLKNKGLLGLFKTFYGLFNKIGEKIFPKKWPFHVVHLFVFKKITK